MNALFCLRQTGPDLLPSNQPLVQTLGNPLSPTRRGVNRVLSGSLKV